MHSRNLVPGSPAKSAALPWGSTPDSRLLDLNVILLASILVASFLGRSIGVQYTSIGVGALALAIAIGCGVRLAQTRTTRRRSLRTELDERLRALGPQVILYSAGGDRDVYQVNMWMETVAALSQPAVIVVRDETMFANLAPTTLPVLCIPNTVELANFGLSTVKTVLYPGNFGNNLHMLRQPGLRHAFIGHGDSDKAASANPFSKVYDEVWVAAEAGRDRYIAAGVGLDASRVIEVGRPQLDHITVAAPRGSAGPLTVLYAPTWEGWVEADTRSSSLAIMGERLIAQLLAMPDVRVIYKPHPLSGIRQRGARRADASIRRMIRRAGGFDAGEDRALVTGRHLIVRGASPPLYECFNVSDLLISDVSSVVVDFIKTQKPYVVTNAHGMPEDQFRADVASARGGYLLSGDCSELAGIIANARSEHDPLLPVRRTLKRYLLGADEVALPGFQREVTRLCGPQPAAGRVPTMRAPLDASRTDASRADASRTVLGAARPPADAERRAASPR